MNIRKLTSTIGKVIKATFLGTVTVHIVAALLLTPIIFSLRFWTPPVHSLMIFRAIYNRHTVQPIQPVSLEKLPYWVPKLFIFLEDRRFFEHWGIDLEAIKTAHRRNRELGRIAFGGSTITQQLSRTLFLTPHRNFIRKYMEAFIAVQIDALLPKERILELYLNVIEWGPGIFGIGNAARVHYRTKAQYLSVEQFSRLAAVLPNPLRFTVRTIERSRGMLQRYQTLLRIFS